MREGSIGAIIVEVLVAFPFVGTTLVVALPVQATASDWGPPCRSDAKSRRWTGCGSVRTEEGTHKGRPYGIPIRGQIQFPLSDSSYSPVINHFRLVSRSLRESRVRP